MGKPDVLLVSFDNSSGDTPILLVGRKPTGKAIDILNAVKGDAAVELYERLKGIQNDDSAK